MRAIFFTLGDGFGEVSFADAAYFTGQTHSGCGRPLAAHEGSIGEERANNFLRFAMNEFSRFEDARFCF